MECSHIPCTCPVEILYGYCSEECSTLGSGLDCPCDHTECRGRPGVALEPLTGRGTSRSRPAQERTRSHPPGRDPARHRGIRPVPADVLVHREA